VGVILCHKAPFLPPYAFIAATQSVNKAGSATLRQTPMCRELLSTPETLKLLKGLLPPCFRLPPTCL